MQRTYLTLWKQYLAEQTINGSTSQEQSDSEVKPADPHYYEPGYKEPYQGADFSMKFPEFPYGMPFYDVLGKKSTDWRPGKEYAKAAANAMKPRVQTTWFATYPKGPYDGQHKILGYHPDSGNITDPITGDVLYSPGKGMSDAAVYQWMFDKYDMPKDVLVGTIGRKQTYGG